MKRITLLFCSCLLFLHSFSSTTADSLAILFSEGNHQYQEKNYEAALESYLQIEAASYTSPSLLYNIGNAYFKSNELGKSILYYEKALVLDPTNEDIIHNLEYANGQIVDRIEAVPQLFIARWWEQTAALFTPNGWGIISIVCASLLAISVLCFLFFRSNFMKNMALLSSIATFSIGVMSVVWGRNQLVKNSENPQAIIMASIVHAKSTPSKSGGDLFVIHEGLKVTITDQLNEWTEVQIPNGEKGWVLYQSIEQI